MISTSSNDCTRRTLILLHYDKTMGKEGKIRRKKNGVKPNEMSKIIQSWKHTLANFILYQILTFHFLSYSYFLLRNQDFMVHLFWLILVSFFATLLSDQWTSGHGHRFNRYIRPILNLFYLSLCNRRLFSPQQSRIVTDKPAQFQNESVLVSRTSSVKIYKLDQSSCL
jgi:hypothetical protein